LVLDVISTSGVNARVTERARARIARKARASTLQFLRAAQAISVRVPLWMVESPEAEEAKVAFMAATAGM
jgi:hypothetical protein